MMSTLKLNRPTKAEHDAFFAPIRQAGGERYAAFLAAGYREYHDRSMFHRSPYMLQKCIKGEVHSKLYYIDVWCYDHSDHVPDHPFGVQPEVQFNTHGDQSPTFDVHLFAGEMSVQAIEDFFRSIYDRMGCQPYDD